MIGNKSKPSLNQCNTIFAMRTFDDTGKSFLANYIGQEYIKTLPSLQERHAVVYGKASSCDNPVLIRLNDRGKFLVANPMLATPKETSESKEDGEEEAAEE